MGKLSLVIFVFIASYLTPCYSQTTGTYTPTEIVTGVNPNTGYLLKEDEERRMKRVFGNATTPIPYKVPGLVSDDEKKIKKIQAESYQSNNKASNGNEVSSNSYQETIKPEEVKYSQVQSEPIPTGVGETKTIPYDKSMDEFIEGVYGYNPNLTIEENKKYYNDNGYTMSYKVKDSTIYTIGGIILGLIMLGLMYKTSRDNHNEKFETQN